MTGRTKAFTLLELVVGVTILVVVATLAFRTIGVQRLAVTNVERLDALQRLRIARAKLSAELELAAAILHPRWDPAASDTVFHQLVFVGPTNELRILYLTSDGQLKIRGPGLEPEIIGHDLTSFELRHSFKGTVTCRMSVQSENMGALNASVSASMANSYCTTGGVL